MAVPIAFGWHPYVTIPGVPRADWEVTLPVESRLVVDDRQIPTGDVEAVEYPQPLRLGDREFDEGYAGIADGTRFAVSGRRTARRGRVRERLPLRRSCTRRLATT